MKNLAGKSFGKWKVISFSHQKGNTSYWKCRCSCGTEKAVAEYSLTSGRSKKCGCVKSLVGKKFGRWTVTSHANTSSKNKHWNCQCDCGVEKVIAGYSLTTGNSKSCGCLLKEIVSLPHGVAAMHAVLRNYTRTAKKRNLPFMLTTDEFRSLTSSDCYYCGCPPNQKIEKVDVSSGKMNGNYIYNGIDRVDNTQGYVFKNCVACCKKCNHSKSNQTQNEFLEWAQQVYNHSIAINVKPRTKFSPKQNKTPVNKKSQKTKNG